MSEETKQQEYADEVIEKLELEDRLAASYIGKEYTLATFNDEDIVFIRGEKGKNSIDLIMTVSGLTEMVEVVQRSVKYAKQSKELDSVEPTE